MSDVLTREIEICHLFLSPISPRDLPSPVPTHRPKLAPYFYAVDISIHVLERFTTTYQQTGITITPLIYNQHVLVADCRYHICFPPGSDIIGEKLAITNHINTL